MADRHTKERRMAAAKKATVAAVAAAEADGGSIKKSKKDEIPSFDELLSGPRRMGRIAKILGGYHIMNVLVPGRGIVEAQCNIPRGVYRHARKTKDHRGARLFNVGDYYIVELTGSHTKAGMATGELGHKVISSEFSHLRKTIRVETKEPLRKAYQTLFRKLGLDDMDVSGADDVEGGFEFAETDSDDDVARKAAETDSDDDVARKAADPVPDAPAAPAVVAPAADEYIDIDIDAI